jgi:small subunit ribosomal protein S5
MENTQSSENIARKKPGSKFKRDRKGGGDKHHREANELDQKILDLARVTRVTAGGKRMRFRATVIVGDKKGKVGIGTAKGADVAIAVEKAYRQAKKKVIVVQIQNDTIKREVQVKYGAAKILMKPAPSGTGLKSGGAMRVVFEMAGVHNVVSKVLGSKNKNNIARATIIGLDSLNKE